MSLGIAMVVAYIPFIVWALREADKDLKQARKERPYW
jgi:hypothetical protein